MIANRKPVRHRNSEQPGAASVCGVKVLVRADGARANEDQRECADKFRDHFLRQTVQASPRARYRSSNLNKQLHLNARILLNYAKGVKAMAAIS